MTQIPVVNVQEVKKKRIIATKWGFLSCEPFLRRREFGCCFLSSFARFLRPARGCLLPTQPRLKQFRHESSPAGLMRCADAAAVVAVEVFMEKNVVFEVRVGRELGVILEHRALTVVAFEE